MDFLCNKGSVACGLPSLSLPPYSPDLAPCDFFLFPQLKSMAGFGMELINKIFTAVQGSIKQLSKNGLELIFKKWQERCHKCIKLEGGYVKTHE